MNDHRRGCLHLSSTSRCSGLRVIVLQDYCLGSPLLEFNMDLWTRKAVNCSGKRALPQVQTGTLQVPREARAWAAIPWCPGSVSCSNHPAHKVNREPQAPEASGAVTALPSLRNAEAQAFLDGREGGTHVRGATWGGC